MTGEVLDAFKRAAVFGYIVPSNQKCRSACKKLVNLGMLEPRRPVGYWLTKRAERERIAYTICYAEN